MVVRFREESFGRWLVVVVMVGIGGLILNSPWGTWAAAIYLVLGLLWFFWSGRRAAVEGEALFLAEAEARKKAALASRLVDGDVPAFIVSFGQDEHVIKDYLA